MNGFSMGLKDWDISRDHPYFGFKIPGEDNKYFYVWLDAPIGYLASLKNLTKKSNVIYEDYFSENADCHLVHFIGKDIIYFHALFWPAVFRRSWTQKTKCNLCQWLSHCQWEEDVEIKRHFYKS